jgi:L-2-hydroxyglutarate oxidase LhgO
MSRPYDVAIVGAGIVGLATAMELSRRRPDLKLVVLEKESMIAAHQTGHNSGVIHAGLYYKPGSLKAKMAVEGSRRMIEFCETHGLPFELCGKVVVARDESELPRLEELYRRGTANGVPGLIKLRPEEIREHEPHATGVAALFSPRTGIVDYVAVTRTYARLYEQAGGELRFDTELTGVEAEPDGLVLKTNENDVQARNLINCGGLESDLVARMTGGTQGLRIVPFRGEYYELTRESQHLVRSLIYPVPDPAFPFLGVHFTKKIHGGVEAGPNAVLAFAREAYKKTQLNPLYVASLAAFPGFWRMAARYWKMGLGEMYRSWNKAAFVKALQTLVPELKPGDIRPAGAGIRAQAMDGQGKLLDDFYFVEAPNAIHVLNAPSPAATASLPIGEAIADKALATFGLSA